MIFKIRSEKINQSKAPTCYFSQARIGLVYSLCPLLVNLKQSARSWVTPLGPSSSFLSLIYHKKLWRCSKAAVGMGEGTRCEDAGVTSIASVTSGHMPRCSYATGWSWSGTTVGASGLHLNTLKILALVKFNMALPSPKTKTTTALMPGISEEKILWKPPRRFKKSPVWFLSCLKKCYF